MDKSFDIFDTLKLDHDKVAVLITDLQATKDRMRQSKLFAEIREELEVHASAEEETVYPFLTKMTSTEALAEKADEDHNEIRDALETLAAIEPEDADWIDSVTALRDAVSNHVSFEETKVFDAIRENFNRSQLEDMKKEFEQARKYLKREIAA